MYGTSKSSCLLHAPRALVQKSSQSSVCLRESGLRVPEPKDLGSVYQLGALSWNLTLTNRTNSATTGPSNSIVCFSPPPPPPPQPPPPPPTTTITRTTTTTTATTATTTTKDGTVPLNLLVGHTTAQRPIRRNSKC